MGLSARMGLLSLGTPLEFLESRDQNENVRQNGVEQLLYVFQAASKRDNDPLYWGDEIEYMMIDFDDNKQNAMLDVTHDEVLTTLNTDEYALCAAHNVHFHPEYGRFMLEATPNVPFKGYPGEYIEFNMQQRRYVAGLAYDKLPKNGSERLELLTLAVFPRMGCTDSVNIPDVWKHKKNTASCSLFLPDEVINRHIRFPTLTKNIRTRRGEKVCIQVPMYKDRNTPEKDDTVRERDWFPREDKESKLASKPGFIYMDAMGFGMGCSCLQTTFQAPNLDKARILYDFFANFAPVTLALSAASPIFKGWLADQDVRWSVISDAVDDRTPQERSAQPLLPEYNKDGYGGIAPELYDKVQRIPKSRYSTVDLFLGGSKFFNRSYNDTEVPVNERVLHRLLENHIAPLDYDLAKHFAHLYIRDPLVIFQENIYQDNKTSTNHFENIQSTNWQTLRIKPPTQEAVPDNKDVPGWRVEFRPLEIQLTDFENAAYSIVTYLLAEYLLTFSEEVNPYMPMSQIWQNMETAHKRDALREEEFYWKDSFEADNGKTSELTINEIFHNKNNGIFAKFINPILCHKGFVHERWEELKESSEHLRLYYYLKLISNRASGKTPSIAKFLRDFVLDHKDYKQDSRVSKIINYDLLELCGRITRLDDSNGELTKLFGSEIATYLPRSKLKVKKN